VVGAGPFELVDLLDGVGEDVLERLGPVPRTAVRSAQPADEVEEPLEGLGIGIFHPRMIRVAYASTQGKVLS
jgi:hypothetical protein